MQYVAQNSVTLDGFVARLRRTAFAALAVSILAAMSSTTVAAADRGAKVYLLRGFMNVFSLGLDELSSKIEKRGIRSEVYNHASWSRLVNEIATEYKSGQTRPVIIIGHSMGGDSAVLLVDALGKAGVPVALAVTLDPSVGLTPTGQVGTFLNLYVKTGAMKAGRGFKGQLVNRDLAKDPEVGHFTIDKVNAVHGIVLRHVAAAAGRRPATSPSSSARAPGS
jgi:hypothetical protein